MKIYSSKNGYYLSGDCVMLHRDGTVYPCIDNQYHPNPGTEETEYDEIERPIDWLLDNDIGNKRVISRWVAARMSQLISDDPEADLTEIAHDVMYDDTYTISSNTRDMLSRVFEILQDPIKLAHALQVDEVEEAREIAKFINENFLRIRAGGKLNPDGTNSIYFRISSHGYNWRRRIEDFLWDTFGSPDKMPNYIWIGHDAETNPPEVTLFEGTPRDFIEYFDGKVAASTQLN